MTSAVGCIGTVFAEIGKTGMSWFWGTHLFSFVHVTLKMPIGYPVGGAVGSWVGKSEARGERGQESAYRFGNHALIYGIEGHGLAAISGNEDG